MVLVPVRRIVICDIDEWVGVVDSADSAGAGRLFLLDATKRDLSERGLGNLRIGPSAALSQPPISHHPPPASGLQQKPH